MQQDPETRSPLSQVGCQVLQFFYCQWEEYALVWRFWCEQVFLKHLGKERGSFSLANYHLWGTHGPPVLCPSIPRSQWSIDNEVYSMTTSYWKGQWRDPRHQGWPREGYWGDRDNRLPSFLSAFCSLVDSKWEETNLTSKFRMQGQTQVGE
jgi:hypothetical protein